jgi:hypothetical protein
MKITTEKTSLLLAVLALGLALPASAQTATDLEPSAPGPGLIGTNYVGLDYGYQKQQGAPSALHDYAFTSNGVAFRKDNWGVDANFTYDYLAGDAFGFRDHRQEVEVGPTFYLAEFWGKPFVTVDGGYAWQDAGGVARKSFAYTTAAGVEFQVMRRLVLAPFVSYQAEPHLYNHAPAVANFPDHLATTGVKATYELTRDWSGSLGIDTDQHSLRDVGLRGGVSYHF